MGILDKNEYAAVFSEAPFAAKNKISTPDVGVGFHKTPARHLPWRNPLKLALCAFKDGLKRMAVRWEYKLGQSEGMGYG